MKLSVCYYSVEFGHPGRDAPPRKAAGCRARGEHARPTNLFIVSAADKELYTRNKRESGVK
jgi:hypothetical protein